MASDPPDTAPDPAPDARDDDPLAWEARYARRAGILALAAGLLTIVGSVISATAQSAVPRAEGRILTIVDTLRLASEGRPIPGGRLAAVAEYLGDNPVPFVAGGVLLGLGGLLAFAPLAYLFRAARHRKPAMSQLVLISAAVGAVGYGVGQAITRTAYYIGATSFGEGGDRSNSAAADALNNSGVAAGGLIAQIGQLALAVAFALIALNAMRVGLLTRFIGVLGVIVGATLILPLDQFGIIRSFWLGMVGLLILGRWPGGRPRAWSVAEAVPWPSNQQIREQREAARRERGGGAPAGRGGRGGKAGRGEEERMPDAPAPQPRRRDPSAGTPHPSSKKKRKRRS